MYQPTEAFADLSMSYAKVRLFYAMMDWSNPEKMEALAHALADLELRAYDLQKSVAEETQRLREVQSN